MSLRLDTRHLQAIKTHAERTYPEECCGLLLGTVQAGAKHLVEVRAIDNTWSPQAAEDLTDAPSLTKSRRYWIAPEALLATMRDARSRNLEVIGVYHSHPDHPAMPSECDRRLAWQQYSYLIVSVRQGHAIECYSWTLDDQHTFQSEPILVDASVPSPFPSTAFKTSC